MKVLQRAAVCAAWLAAFGISGAAVAAPDRIISSIDPGSTVPLAGALRPQLRAAIDLGRMDPAAFIGNASIHFRRSPQQQAELEMLLREQQTAGSPAWHQWLTPAQFGERFGMGQGDLARVQRWLEAEGLEVTGIAPGRNQMSFGGTAAHIERAFGVELHHYRYDGENHFASATAPRLPAALDGIVVGLRHLDDFRPRPLHVLRQDAKADGVSPQFNNNGGTHQLVPADVVTIYDIQPLYKKKIDGSGITIAVVGQATVDMTDIEAFRIDAGLPANDPVVVPVPGTGGSSTTSAPADVTESDLDLEWAGGIAYGASIKFVTTSGSDGYNAIDSLEYAIQANVAPIISVSYGACEPTVTSDDIDTFTGLGQQANAQGQTIVASSGDSGAAACDPQGDAGTPAAEQGIAVNFPADLAEVTAVGGTEFSGDVDSSSTYWSAFNGINGSSAKKYIPETAWNDSDGTELAASGGGASTLVGKPDWQGGIGVPADGHRDVPDIAFSASAEHDPYLICTDATCSGSGFASDFPVPIGGTSVSAPVFAGVLALLEQSSGSTGEGNLNLLLYTLAATSSTYASVFHDVTTGSNAVPCVSGSPDCPDGTKTIGYDAGAGYDLATGLGSIDVDAMSTVFVASQLIETSSQLTIVPNRIQLGTPITLTATIKPQSLGADAVLGTVQFVLDGKALGGPAAVVNQQATLTITPPDLGIHTLSATYQGSSGYAASEASGTVTVLSLPPDQDSKAGGGGALPPFMIVLMTVLAGWRRRRRHR